METDDGEIKLSASTLAALEEFYAERDRNSFQENNAKKVDEDWELSQFWYTEKTSKILADECLRLAKGEGRKIACISCPTVFKTLYDTLHEENTNHHAEVFLFEFDRRFEDVYGDYFIFYDFNQQAEETRQDLRGFFDVLIVDPPFLSDECLTKVAETVKFLSKFVDSPIVLCTGAVMEAQAKCLFNVEPCKFVPRHVRKLGNEFRCYINYRDSEILNNSSDFE